MTQQWETSDEYLSGNVREKLATAETFAANHAEYQINVDYLKRVQPKDLDASEIEVRLGANWVKPEYITQFMKEVFKTPNYYAGIDMLMAMFEQPTLKDTIQVLTEVQPLLAADAEMAALVQQTIPKMQQLNEQQFKGLELEWHRPEEPEKEKT